MALLLIKPGDLPVATSVDTDAAVMVQNGEAVERATPQQVVDAGRPIASEIEAVTGTDNTKAMTPLTVRQAIDADTSGSVAQAIAAAEAAEASALDAESAEEQTGLDALATAADRVQTGLDRIATAADRVQTGLDAAATDADAVATAADRIQTGLDAAATDADAIATAADRVQTGLDRIATAADRVQTGLDRTAAEDAADAAAASAAEIQALILNPLSFGAAGDGVADDTIAMQAAIDELRTRANAVTGQSGATKLDLAGLVYRTTAPLDGTGISSWGWGIKNGTIIGDHSGNGVLDMTASRGGHLEDIVVYGTEAGSPRTGLQSARGTGTGQIAFCDNIIFSNVTVHGFYSLAAAYFYGQETATHKHCRYWNSNPDGYAGIHVGFDFEPYISDFQATITGETSYINDKYINCDWRYLPIGRQATISGITQANPAVVTTATPHPFVNGDTVVLTQVNGMGEINNVKAVVASATSTTFALTGVDATGFGAYTSGGFVCISQTKPTLLFGRGEQHSFDTCYTVNYGTDSVEWAFPSTQATAETITMDFLFEGAGSRSHVRIATNDAVSPDIRDFVFKTYNTHSRDSIFSTDATTSNIAFYGAQISNASEAFGTPDLLDTPSRYAFYGSDILGTVRSRFDPASATDFRGSYTALSDGLRVDWNTSVQNSVDGTFTPTITASTGTITSSTATGTIKRIGGLVFVTIDATITNNGTGAGEIVIGGLPLQPALSCAVSGREVGVSGVGLAGQTRTAAPEIIVRRYDNAYPGATGARLLVSCVYTTSVAMP